MRSSKPKTLIVSALIIGLAIVIIMPAMVGAASDKRTDQAIQTLLEKRLKDHGVLKNNNLQVSVANDSIVIAGTVPTIADKMKAEKDAQKVEEHYTIVDKLTLQPLTLTDQQLLDKVVDKIKHNIFYSIFDWVTIGVTNGTVTLNGWVNEPWHKSLFQHQVEKVAGVTAINNNITILPVSIFDDEIRARAARLIYDNYDFEPFALAMNPSIHIIVDNGKVTLEGYVTSRYQQSMAEYLINLNTNALQITNNLQIVP
jgi:hyperosmotically inducible protein